MKRSFNSVYDVQQLLKQFGIFVYVGERMWDLEIMMDELKKIYRNKLIGQTEFLSALTVLKKEHQREKQRLETNKKNNHAEG